MGTKLKGGWDWTTEKIVEFISSHPDLTYVELHYKDFTNKASELSMIFGAMSAYPITHININGCSIGDKGMNAIAGVLKNFTALNNLNFTANEIGAAGAMDLITLLEEQKLSQLTYLSLTKNDLEDNVANRLIEAVSKNCKSLQEFHLGDMYFGAGPTIAVARMLMNSSLQVLVFNWKEGTSAESQTALFQALKCNTSLHTFDTYGKAPIQLLDECFAENKTIVKTPTSGIPSRYARLNQVCKSLNASDIIRKSVPKGLEATEEIRQYVGSLMKHSEEWRAMKVVVLGHGEIGKTTLLDAFKKTRDAQARSQQSWFRWAKEYLVTSRTVGIDHSRMKVGTGEVTIWDFAGQLQYTVTHHFFLSIEMVLYLVCFDLSAPLDKQMEQLGYWLDFLNSALPPSPPSALPKWKVMVVGLKSDKCADHFITSDLVPTWKNQWTNLPLHNEFFRVSSFTNNGVKALLASVERACDEIFNFHTTLIPTSFKDLLHSLQSIDESSSITSVDQLFTTHSQGMERPQFTLALKYLHSIGHVVLMKSGMICTSPTVIPKRAAKFISPKEVRVKLVSTNDVELLEENAVGLVLGQNSQKLQEELALLEQSQVCFKLAGPKLQRPIYLFPSLTTNADKILFSHKVEDFQFSGVRFSLSKSQLIFVPGFFCQLIVSLFVKLNVSLRKSYKYLFVKDSLDLLKLSKRELLRIYNNGVVVSCSGLFFGELIVKIEADYRSILFLMMAADPDVSLAVSVFKSLVTEQFSQYFGSEQSNLCSVCIELTFLESKLDSADIGVLETDNIHDGAQFCVPKHHKIQKPGAVIATPLPVSKAGAGLSSQHKVESCRTHKQTHHDFFLNYRVAVEGKKSQYSTEGNGGFVEVFYEKLATMKKTKGDSVFVFWDKKCLKYGQDWEQGFMHGITHSKVIVLLISNKVLRGIAENAPTKQDNVLIEYECALLQNFLHGTPVFSVFLAEIVGDAKFEPFASAVLDSLPDVPHARGLDAQELIDELSHTLTKKKRHVATIKNTIRKLQGHRLAMRGEDKVDLERVINLAMEALEDS